MILSDLRMPVMSGFELLSIVRRRFPHIPTIAISCEYILATMPLGLLVDHFFSEGWLHPSAALRQNEGSDRGLAHTATPRKTRYLPSLDSENRRELLSGHLRGVSSFLVDRRQHRVRGSAGSRLSLLRSNDPLFGGLKHPETARTEEKSPTRFVSDSIT